MLDYKLTNLDFAADSAATNSAWAGMLEKIRASDAGNLRRVFIDVSKLYTFETWNFTFLDTELLLCLCEVNYILYANFYRFSQDQALLASEFARGMDLLAEAVERRLARGAAPEDPSNAVALLRGLMGPSPAERYRTEDGWAIYWGDTHVHSAFSYDAFGSPAHCHEFGRQVAGFDFMCLTDHDFAFDSARHPYFSVSVDRMFGLIAEAARRASTPDFLALVGYEWGGRFAQGHRHVLFAPGSLPKFANGYSVARESCASITRLFRQLCRDGVNALAIPHHTAYSAAGMGNALRWWNPDYERLIEVVSENGESEWPGWELPLDEKGITMVGRTVTDALTKGMRLGILASSDNHTGTPGLCIEGKTGFGGKTGYAAVLARSASYADIYDALKARRCYGTDGRKIFLGFWINGHPMGSEIDIHPETPLEIHVDAVGTAPIDRVELLCNEVQEFIWSRPERSCRLTHCIGAKARSTQSRDAMDVNDRLRLTQQVDSSGDFYRVVLHQVDGFRAWSSPIWVDYLF